jgi:hypothetical protein
MQCSPISDLLFGRFPGFARLAFAVYGDQRCLLSIIRHTQMRCVKKIQSSRMVHIMTTELLKVKYLYNLFAVCFEFVF